MSRKPGGAGGRGRTVALVRPSCPVCLDRKVMRFIPLADAQGSLLRVKCPHCGSGMPVHTYYQQGKS